MTITLNNNVKVTLNNSKVLIRWDSLQILQPEKVEILKKWFNAIKVYPRTTSTPVVDVTDGIVYARCGCDNDKIGSINTYKNVRRHVRESVLENITYGAKNDCVYGLHTTNSGRNLIGHRFISVGDASKEYLEAIYAQYMEKVAMKKETVKATGITEVHPKKEIQKVQEIPESNIKEIFNLHYSKKGNKSIQDITKSLGEIKKCANKIYNLTFGGKVEEYYDDVKEIEALSSHVWNLIHELRDEELLQIGGIRTTRKELFDSFEKAGISFEAGMKAIKALETLKK